jgi:hypothetical protein
MPLGGRRAEVQRDRDIHYEFACDYGERGDAEREAREYATVAELDETLAAIDREDGFREVSDRITGFEVISGGDVLLFTPAKDPVLITYTELQGIAEAARSKAGS